MACLLAGVQDALVRDRAAVNTLRKILSYFPTEKRELRQVGVLPAGRPRRPAGGLAGRQ